MLAFLADNKELLIEGLKETMYMTLVSTFFAYVLGLPMGVLSYITAKDSLKPNRPVNAVLGAIINATRSVPFIVLIVALIPLTRFIAGKAIGSTAVIIPLVIGAAPFIARLVETSLKELDKGLILATKAMGASNFQIITKVLLPETVPSLVRGMSIACITILGYTAMAGTVGGGGLGQVAIDSYNTYEYSVLYATVVVLIIVAQILEKGFALLAKGVSK